MKAKVSLSVLAVLVVLSLSLSLACTRAPNDAQIVSEVQAKIGTDANIQTKQIQVQSNNGVVTLSGTVANEFERTAAANDAAQAKGVKTVVNNLQVETATVEPAPEAAPEPEQPAARQPAPRRPAPVRRAAAPERRPSAARVYNETTPPATSYPAPAASAPAPAPVRMVTVPDGTSLSVRLIDSLDSEQNQVGDTFRASLASPVTVGDETVIPANADVEGRVVDVKSAGHFKGQSVLTLELTRLMVNGKTYNLTTSQWSKQGTSRGKRTAGTVGGGAALGAIIGGIAGGGKGAAIGAAVGAGAGTGVQAATKGQQIKLASETVLNFTLENPISVVPSNRRVRED